MGRLTERDGKGNWKLKGIAWEQLRTGAVLDQKTAEILYGALYKLKDYEDTGLLPDKEARRE